jgi:hypothetical protein
MKASDKKIKEPFRPEETPQPPQIIDPSNRDEGKIRTAKDQGKQKKNVDTGRRLGESPLEIDDETTI